MGQNCSKNSDHVVDQRSKSKNKKLQTSTKFEAKSFVEDQNSQHSRCVQIGVNFTLLMEQFKISPS